MNKTYLLSGVAALALMAGAASNANACGPHEQCPTFTGVASGHSLVTMDQVAVGNGFAASGGFVTTTDTATLQPGYAHATADSLTGGFAIGNVYAGVSGYTLNEVGTRAEDSVGGGYNSASGVSTGYDITQTGFIAQGVGVAGGITGGHAESTNNVDVGLGSLKVDAGVLGKINASTAYGESSGSTYGNGFAVTGATNPTNTYTLVASDSWNKSTLNLSVYKDDSLCNLYEDAKAVASLTSEASGHSYDTGTNFAAGGSGVTTDADGMVYAGVGKIIVLPVAVAGGSGEVAQSAYGLGGGYEYAAGSGSIKKWDEVDGQDGIQGSSQVITPVNNPS
jgi:hypothetical protein